jgi:hypothetical protein
MIGRFFELMERLVIAVETLADIKVHPKAVPLKPRTSDSFIIADEEAMVHYEDVEERVKAEVGVMDPDKLQKLVNDQIQREEYEAEDLWGS